MDNLTAAITTAPLSVTLAWVGLALILGCIEIITTSFAFMLIAGSALLAAVASAAHFTAPVQVATFAIGILLSLTLLRPRLLKRLHSPTHLPSRTAFLVGQIGKMVSPVEGGHGRFRVLVNGEDWAAHSEKVLAAGTEVKIIGTDGIVLQVEEKN